MQAARKIEAFCVDRDERRLFAGDLSGRILTVGIDDFSIQRDVQAHAGTIIAMAASPSLPLFACLGMDRTVSVWEYDRYGRIHPVTAASIRNVRPGNDEFDVDWVHSNAQTLGFHDTEARLVTRSGNAGILVLDIDDGEGLRVRRCDRFHGEWDVVTARFAVGSDRILSGSGAGQLVLSEDGEVLHTWQVGEESIHWIEHYLGDQYLLASDARLLARVDIGSSAEPKIGEKFARDDFENVCFNRRSGKVYASSFDRNVYEMDPETCAPTRVAHQAPFKCRWLHTLERQPEALIVQTRDGGLHKVDVGTGRTSVTIKKTPPALWSGVVTADGDVLLSGEGSDLLRISVVDVDDTSLERRFATERVRSALPDDGYTKRMEHQESTGRTVIGRIDGSVWRYDDGECFELARLSDAVRDLTIVPDRPELFVACEDGKAYKLDLETGATLAEFESPDGYPIWSLAYNPGRDALALLERHGVGRILSAQDFSLVAEPFAPGRNKRAKWFDDDRLLFSCAGGLHEYDLRSQQQREVIGHVGNNIEDFIWDEGRTYIAMICYTWMLSLYDAETYQKLTEVPDQVDYSKGMMWLPRTANASAYPLDFITFGRSGTAHLFRIHNENLVALGTVGPGLAELPLEEPGDESEEPPQ